MVNEHLSAWIDGELDDIETMRVAEGVAGRVEHKRACAMCWLIGDVLRGEPALSSDFTRRVMEQLDTEPTVLAPKPVADDAKQPVEGWRWMPMAAALAGVAVAGWIGLSVWNGAAHESLLLAKRQATAAQVATAKTPDVRTLASDRSYLMAHQASSMGVPMAGVAQYIRTVSDEHTAGAR